MLTVRWLHFLFCSMFNDVLHPWRRTCIGICQISFLITDIDVLCPTYRRLWSYFEVAFVVAPQSRFCHFLLEPAIGSGNDRYLATYKVVIGLRIYKVLILMDFGPMV